MYYILKDVQKAYQLIITCCSLNPPTTRFTKLSIDYSIYDIRWLLFLVISKELKDSNGIKKCLSQIAKQGDAVLVSKKFRPYLFNAKSLNLRPGQMIDFDNQNDETREFLIKKFHIEIL